VAQSAGARFYRADLHVHSFRASYDVKDSAMNPAAIVDTAVAEGLMLLAITDHNDISNVPELIEVAKNKRICVIPGVELSTPEGHLLVYFETLQALAEFYGRLNFADRGTAESRCQTSLLDCLKQIDPTSSLLKNTDSLQL
jgi:histidinol phosphatase-like PHP family hydrolase